MDGDERKETNLVASNMLSNKIQCLQQLDAQLLALLISLDSNVFDVSLRAQLEQTK